MSIVALTLVLLPAQEPVTSPAAVLARLEVPSYEEFLGQVPETPGVVELLALPDRLLADQYFAGWSNVVHTATALRMFRSEKAISHWQGMAARMEVELGGDHPLLLRIGVALDEEVLRGELGKGEKKRLRAADASVIQARQAYKREDFAGARQLFVDAIDGRLEFFEPSSEPIASLCESAGKSAAALGDVASAERWTLAAAHLYIQLFGADHPASADALQQLGYLRLGQGDRAGAERLLLWAFQLFAVNYGPRSFAAWYAGNELGALYQELGRFPVARAIWEAGDAALAQVPVPEAAAHLDNLSVVLRDLDERRQAEEACRRALKMRRKLYGAQGHPHLAVSLHNLSSIVEVRGDLAEAEALSRECVELRERLFGESDPATLRAIGALGTLLQRRGDTGGAIAHLTRAVAGLRTAVYPRSETDLALQLRNLASALIQDRRGEEAGTAAKEALELYAKHYGPDHRMAGQCHSSLGIAALLDGRPDEARREVSEALRIARANLSEKHPEVAIELERLANLDWRDGERASARARLVEALEIARLSLPDSPLEARLLAELGRMDMEDGDLTAARRSLARSFELTDQRRTNLLGGERAHALFSARLEHREISRLLAWAFAVEGNGPESFDILARGRDRVLSDLLARASSETAQDRATPFLAGVLATEERARNRAQGLMRSHQASVSLEQLAAAQHDVDAAEKATASAIRERWPATRAATWKEAQGSLEPGELLCSFGWTPHGVLLLITAPEFDGVRVYHLASGSQNVSELASRLASVSRGWALGDKADDATRASQGALAETLFPPPVRASVLAAKRVIVVPDGPLSTLPFAALPLGSRGEAWIDVGPELVFATSAGLFGDRRERARALGKAVRPSVIAVGDPVLDGKAVEASALRNELPGSLREARRIGARFRAVGGEALVLLGAEATVSRVREAARGATHLHLSCHGIAASEGDPFLAGLDLADGTWSLAELLRNDVGLLERAELVVLAACESRRGSRLGDQDVALPWGFLAAGAPAVIASLWRVDDGATALLMDRFYGNVLGREGEPAGQPMPVGAALREAKRWLKSRTPEENRRAIAELGIDPRSALAGPSRGEFGGPPGPPGPLGPPGPTGNARAVAAPFDYSHPRYWAAFQVFGAPD